VEASRRTVAWVVGGVAAAAVVARLVLLAFPESPDVDLSYAVARHWGADPANVVPPYSLQSALWWQRPLSFALVAPSAALGMTAFRVAIALAASLAPPMVALAVLRLRGRPWLAALAGLAAAVHPTLVQAGTDAWPASLAAAAAVGAFLAAAADRPLAAGFLALASAWCHPAGLAFAVAWLAVAVVRAARRGQARAYPLELDRAATAAAGALLLGVLPSAAGWLLLSGPALASASGSGVAATAFLAPWLLVVGGLASAAGVGSRRWAIAVAVVAALAAAPWLPGLAAARADPLEGAVAALGPRPWDSVLLVDVDWRLVPHPFADQAQTVGWSYTGVALPLGDWVHAVEGSGHTVLHKEDRTLNRALRAAYAACVSYEDRHYVVLDGRCTPGHGDGLRAIMGEVG
jgi:hypothetical protein